MEESERIEYLCRKEQEEESRRNEDEQRKRREEEATLQAAVEARLQAEQLARYTTFLSHQPLFYIINPYTFRCFKPITRCILFSYHDMK